MLFSTADYILNKFKSNPPTHIKLQKLVYFSFGFYAAKNKGARLFEQPIQAWSFGPVIPKLYDKIKEFGIASSCLAPSREGDLNEAQCAAIDLMLRTYGNKTEKELVEYTHLPDTLWSRYYKEGVRNIEIPKEEIIDYYRKAFMLANILGEYREAFVALAKT